MNDREIVEIRKVNKYYGATHVVKNLDMTIYRGEFLSILGPSGCGKTTTLRMIAGFEQQSSGDIFVENERVENKEPFERDVNTVFQSYALFPHMTIKDNISFGLRMKKIRRDEIEKRVAESLAMVQLEGFEKRYPSQLSGGQKQRVAIARAIINRPKVLLLDEPLGALDMKLRKQMQMELKRLQKRLGITFVYVTHDQEEALTMSDRVAVMNAGVLEQIDTPYEIYSRPVSKFVADFIGESNLFEGFISGHAGDSYEVAVECGKLLADGKSFSTGEIVNVSVRPENTLYSTTPVDGFTIKGVVKDHIFIGTLVKTIVMLQDNNEIRITVLSGQEPPRKGSVLFIHWRSSDAVIMRTSSQNVYSYLENVDLSMVPAEG